VRKSSLYRKRVGTFAAFISGNALKFGEESRSLLGGTKEGNMAFSLELIRPSEILTVRDSIFSNPREIYRSGWLPGSDGTWYNVRNSACNELGCLLSFSDSSRTTGRFFQCSAFTRKGRRHSSEFNPQPFFQQRLHITTDDHKRFRVKDPKDEELCLLVASGVAYGRLNPR